MPLPAFCRISRVVRGVFLFASLIAAGPLAIALERAEESFRIFQFPADKIPRIDGNADDWSIVPESYVIGTDKLVDDSGRGRVVDRKSLDVRVRVGWVKGLNQLYFLYEATDDYWDFARPDLHNDTFEIVVDGDMSGGPLIERFHPEKSLGAREKYFSFQNTHAQNYHIFTPAEGKDWCMAWGPQAWIKELPFANAKCSYQFKPGESGKLVLEFWITPFDYAGAEGPARAVESVLREGGSVGLCWAIIDYDGVDKRGGTFWNLSPKHTMYGQASELIAFKLMPLEPGLVKPLEAQWSFRILDMDRRVVAFQDKSVGEVKTWTWDFGDGTTSREQHPVHSYTKAGDFVVVLTIEGPSGTSRRAKVWDVALR